MLGLMGEKVAARAFLTRARGICAELDRDEIAEEHQGQRATFDFTGRVLAGQIHSRTAKRLIRD